MSECNHNCANCTVKCASSTADTKLAPNRGSHIRHIIGIVSGKGGVGKSLVTCMLATSFAKKGNRVGILDADITGPSVPHAFGLSGLKIEGDEFGMIPAETPGGIRMISVNLLVEEESKPVLLRGAAISATVKQFWSEVHWGELDYLFIDMPPGTGDVPLTIYQNLPLDGIVLVGTPQTLVSMIVKKAVYMAKRMNVPLLGFIENMSFIRCPDCGKEIALYGNGKLEALARECHSELLGRLPLDPRIASDVDCGLLEKTDLSAFHEISDKIEKKFS